MPDHEEPQNEESAVEAQPLLRIVNGDPTPEELAALVSVVSAMAAASPADVLPTPTPEWGAHHRKLRAPHRHGPGAWRATAR